MYDYSNYSPTEVRVRAYTGNDMVVASAATTPLWAQAGVGDDQLIGGAATDTLNGAPGNDQLIGRGGDDRLLGGEGNDTYGFDADGPLGSDTIIDTGGHNGLWFGDTTAQPIRVDLSQAGAQVVNSNLTLTLSAGDSMSDVTGGLLGDTLIGNALSNNIWGGPGDDVLIGGPGDDNYGFDTDEPMGNDIIVDAEGLETLWFALTTTQPVRVDLSKAGPQVVNYTACERGVSVRFTRVVDMLNGLTAAQINGTLAKALKVYTTPSLLLLDELGYLPIDKRGADLMFQVVAARYEFGSIVITTNRAFRDWGKIFDVDNTLATAMIDRLMHHGEAVVIQGDSYRLKDRPPE